MEAAVGDVEALLDNTHYEEAGTRPERIVIFGKGGIGKSTVAANLSAVLSRGGKKVMHIGCDPKADSTSLLVERERMAPVLSPTAGQFNLPTIEEMIVSSRLGIDCLEAGGPTPGVGCGGRGVSLVLQLMQREELIPRNGYEAILFDVLGDVVCGGFASPLRKGFGEKVVIVASEELMALYAANNIGRAVLAYWENGVRLVGLIANCKDPDADKAAVHRFARMLNTKVLGFIPRDPLVREAEYEGKSLVEMDPDARITKIFQHLAAEIYHADIDSLPKPTPLTNDEFYDLSRKGFPEEWLEQRDAVDDARVLAELNDGLKPDSLFREMGPPGQEFQPVEGDAPAGANAKPGKAFNILKGPLPTTGGAQASSGGCGTSASSSGGGCSSGGCGTTATQTSKKPIPGERRDPEDEYDPGESLFNAWQPDRRWRLFFCDEELSLNVTHITARNLTVIVHEELECHFVNARTDDGTVAFLNYPWPDHTGPDVSTYAKLRESNSVVLISDIGDEEVVLGGTPKLTRMLQQVANDETRKTDLIMVHGSCPPAVNGDDIFGTVDAVGRQIDIPIVHMDNAMDQERDFFVGVFRSFTGTPEFQASVAARNAPDAKRRINLCGFPQDQTWDELAAALGDLGVTINAVLLPSFDVDAIKAFPNAALNVLRDHRSYDLIYDTVMTEVEETVGLPSIKPVAPYGVKGTRAWLDAIGEALDLPEGWRARLDAKEKSARARFDALRARAAGKRVAFVVDEWRVKRIASARYTAGIPMIDVLREAGFGIELLVWCDKCDPAGPSRHRAWDPDDSRTTRIRYFHGPDELDALLRADDFQAVYSDIYFDYRITDAGKSQFSLAFFEAGFEGALRTVEKLLGACELPFYQKYQRYLRGGVSSRAH